MNKQKNPARQTSTRIAEILGKMSLAEKAGQMNQIKLIDENVDRLVADGLAGSLICSSSAWAGNDLQENLNVRRINALQRVAVETSRLGIPLIVGRDVIHGHRAVGPIPLGQAAPWFASVIIAPQLGGLRHAEIELPHPRGKIAVRLTREAGGLDASVTLPEGCDGRFVWNHRQAVLTGGDQHFRL